jgi:dTDP-4-amino-4,6-dideoxygalactose transaminase
MLNPLSERRVGVGGEGMSILLTLWAHAHAVHSGNNVEFLKGKKNDCQRYSEELIRLPLDVRIQEQKQRKIVNILKKLRANFVWEI